MSDMNRFKTYGLVGLCGVGVLATVDTAFGLGGSALLADICMTILDGGEAEGGMANMPMEVKPVPLIALSLTATTAAIWALAKDHRRFADGRSEPDDEERASILSAMLIVSAAQGRGSREEFLDTYRIVTTHELDRDLLDLACERMRSMSNTDIAQYRLPPVSSSIGRRRTLAAAMMMGCVARPATPQVSELIEMLALDIGASVEDIAVARGALERWREDCPTAEGVSLVTVLRHRALQMAPT